jgi:hypothetical protein
MRPPRERLAVSSPWDDPAIAARMRKAELLAALERRRQLALILQRRGRTGLTEATEKPLYEAAKCHTRALRHHRAVTRYHDAARDHLDELRTVHRKLTATLERLGEVEPAVTRHLASIDEHMDRARDSLETAADHAVNVGAAVTRAAGCVRSVLTSGLEESAPSDKTEDEEQADIEDKPAARARRRRAFRFREIGPRAV